MSVVDKALNGEWVEILLKPQKFDIPEDMTMTFEGRSCHIEDSEKNLVESLGLDDGIATRDVFTGYRCYVTKGRIKFEKKPS
jgi:hypothetical protein